MVLTCVLGALVTLGVLFALQTIFHTRDFRAINAGASFASSRLIEFQALRNDVLEYSKTHPDIDNLLRPAQSKPVKR
jgi:hypothetical protein